MGNNEEEKINDGGDQLVGIESSNNTKWCSIAAYLIFFIPLVLDKESSTGKFHANQGLNLLLLSIAINVMVRVIPIVGILVIGPLGGILTLVLFIMGVLNAINGREKELPLVGRFRLIE